MDDDNFCALCHVKDPPGCKSNVVFWVDCGIWVHTFVRSMIIPVQVDIPVHSVLLQHSFSSLLVYVKFICVSLSFMYIVLYTIGWR